jgi:hypothetical protein
MKVSWASSWGVFAALTEAVYFPRNQFSKKTGNRTAECGLQWDSKHFEDKPWEGEPTRKLMLREDPEDENLTPYDVPSQRMDELSS